MGRGGNARQRRDEKATDESHPFHGLSSGIKSVYWRGRYPVLARAAFPSMPQAYQRTGPSVPLVRYDGTGSGSWSGRDGRYLIATSSISKISVAFGPMSAPAPRSP